MTENMKKFLELACKSEELRKKLSGIDKKAVIAMAMELGIALTEDDFAKPTAELDDDELDTVAGGANGYNPGWAYGPCRKCPGTRYAMQLDYKNIIACPSCGDWVEF